MLLIASVFMAQSAFAVTATIQEALNPPDTFVVMITAPVEMTEFIYEASPMVTPSANVSSHLSTYIINKSDEIPGQDTLSHFREVETVLKFPYLIRQNSLKYDHILVVGLVS